jgi:hypothetical protein
MLPGCKPIPTKEGRFAIRGNRRAATRATVFRGVPFGCWVIPWGPQKAGKARDGMCPTTGSPLSSKPTAEPGSVSGGPHMGVRGEEDVRTAVCRQILPSEALVEACRLPHIARTAPILRMPRQAPAAGSPHLVRCSEKQGAAKPIADFSQTLHHRGIPYILNPRERGGVAGSIPVFVPCCARNEESSTAENETPRVSGVAAFCIAHTAQGLMRGDTDPARARGAAGRVQLHGGQP